MFIMRDNHTALPMAHKEREEIRESNSRNSRLRDNRERDNYLGILLLQLIPFTLAGGTGVRLGLAFLSPKGRWGYPTSERAVLIARYPHLLRGGEEDQESREGEENELERSRRAPQPLQVGYRRPGGKYDRRAAGVH